MFREGRSGQSSKRVLRLRKQLSPLLFGCELVKDDRRQGILFRRWQFPGLA
jgi:hypothetical protein